MLIGTDSVYSYTFEHERRPECPVCGGESVEVSMSRDWTVDRLIEMLVEKQDMYVFYIFIYFRLHDTYRDDKPNKETVAIHSNEANIFPGTAATRRGDTPESREEGVRLCA